MEMFLHARTHYLFKKLFRIERRDVGMCMEFGVLVVFFNPQGSTFSAMRLTSWYKNENFSSHLFPSTSSIPTDLFLLLGLFFPCHILLHLHPVQMYNLVSLFR